MDAKGELARSPVRVLSPLVVSSLVARAYSGAWGPESGVRFIRGHTVSRACHRSVMCGQ